MNDTSHRKVITLDTYDKVSDNEAELMLSQLRWLCQVHLIKIKNLTIEDK